MPDLVKKWKEKHPYLQALEEEIQADDVRKWYQEEQQRQEEERRREESATVTPDWRERDAERGLTPPVPSGGNGHTADLEAEFQRRNGRGNRLTPFQEYMRATVASMPEQEETRSTDELRRDMNRQNRLARATNRMAADMGSQLLRDQSGIYDPVRSTNLGVMARTMEQQQEKADRATELYRTESTRRRWQEEQAKYASLMSNPDFITKSQGDPAIGNKASSTSLAPAERLYQKIFHRNDTKDANGNIKDAAGSDAARFVNDEEAAIFYYLWNTQGAKAAQSYYYGYVENRAGERRAQLAQRQARAYGEYDPVGASIARVGYNAMSGIGLVDMALQNITRALGITDRNKPLNYNSGAQLPGQVADALQSGASNFVEQFAADEIKRINPNVKHPENYAKVASFLYQTGMSMADSSVAIALNLMGIPEPLTLANMGAAAGTRAIREARERGATDGQALAFGISSAIMEALFEKISLDRILEPSYAQTTKAHLLNALKQSTTEGSEEVMTTLANTAADMLIMGDKAELFAIQRQLMEQGVSEKEALGAAFKQWGTGIIGDLLGGLISGFGMGGAKEVGTGLGIFAQGVRQDMQTSREMTAAQNREAAQAREQALRTAYEQTQNRETPQPVQPRQQTAREQNPLQFALTKVQNGETLTKNDARAIIENPQALQALRDSGVLTGKVTNDSEGRGKVVDAVNALAERQTEYNEARSILGISDSFANIQPVAQERTAVPMPSQENAQQEERVNTPPVPSGVQQVTETRTETAAEPATAGPPLPSRMTQEQESRAETPAAQESAQGASEGLRLPSRAEAAESKPTPRANLTIGSRNVTLNENRQEANNGRKTEAADAERFRAEAQRNAAGRQADGGGQWSTGVARLLDDVRNYRTVRDLRGRADQAASLQNQADARNLRYVSGKELGVEGASDAATARILDNDMLGREWEQTVKEYAAKGVTLRAMTGQIETTDLRANGLPVTVRAWVSGDGKNIIVQADHPTLSWQQLLAHEELHRRIKGDDAYRRSVQDALLADEKLKPYLSRILDRYTEAYRAVKPGITDAEIVEELLADYRAGFDMLDPLGLQDRNTARAARAAAKDIRAVERKAEKSGEDNPLLESQQERKASIQPIIGDSGIEYGLGVYLDSTLLADLTEKQRVEMVIERLKELGGQAFTAYDQNGDAVQISIAPYGRRFKNSKGKSVPVNQDLAKKYTKLPNKQEAVVLADELIQASTYRNSESSIDPHDWLDNYGANPWDKREVYLQGNDNSVWKATLHIANTADGEKILYDVVPIEMVEQRGESRTSTTDVDNTTSNRKVNSESEGSTSIEIDPEVAAQFSPQAIAEREARRSGRTGGKKKVSKVRSNTYEYSGLYNEVEAQMSEADEQNYTYDPVSEKKSMNEALGRLKADFDGEVGRLSEADRQWGGSDLDTAMGILHRYRTEGRATGDYSDFWNWSKVIQEKGTKGGQFIQAFAKYTRTGTGAAMKGAKDIHDRFKLNPAQQKQVDAAKKGLMDGIAGDLDGAAQDAMKQAKGKKEPTRKQDGKVDKKKLDAEVQRRKDAERLVREISKLFEKQQNHGEPVENWLNLTGEELARKIAGRFSEPKQRTKTTMQTILSDLVGFAEEHALPERQKAEGERRTAIDIITDYLNNRDAYGTAWAAAQSYLRAAYTDDQEKLDALNSFLTATIAYNAEGTDRTMLDAILQSADVLGISEKRILELTSAGATESTIDRIGDELVSQVKERMGADYDESFTQQLKDAVRRHITGIALQESAEEQRLRLSGMTTDAARQLEINLQKLLTQSRGDKNKAAQSVADYLIRELGIPSSDAAIAAERITGAFMDELASRADRKLQQMFAEKKPKTQEQRDKLLDLIRLGGLTNSNVEDAVVDALGIGKLSRERQRELVGAMAQFGETLDAMEADDAEGLRQLIREQAAVRGTKLSRLSEKTLSGETDIEYLRDFALAQLASIAGDFENRSAGEMISTYQTISHLLNMRTALRNVTSNQVFDLIDSAANNVSLLPDIALSLMTGKRTVGLNKSWASQQKRQGAVQGARRNALEVNLDVGVDDRQKSKYGTAGRRTWAIASSRTAGKILSHLEEVMGYELNTTDEFHKGSVMGETLESLSRFVDRGDMTLEEAQEFATEMALYRSFQDDSLIGTMLSSIKDALNLAGVGEQNGKQLKGKKVHDFGLGDFVTKYTQVPGALVHRAIEFSPLGYAKALFNLGQLANARRQGYETNAAQRKAALAIGRATTGTGLITLFAALAKAGLLRRDEDEDKNAKAAHQAQGLNGTQLNLTALGRKIEGGSAEPEDGDILIDINFLEPLDALMGLATLVANEDERNLESIWNDSITAVWDSISSLSMMQTLRDAYNVYQYYDDKAEDKMPLMNQMLLEIASSSLSGFIPSPVRQLAQATDTTYRDQYRSKKISDQMRDKAKNSIPGLRQTLAPKITPLGEDKKYEKPLLNYLNATLNPGNISVYKSNKVVDELNRVYGETDDEKIWPERNAPYSFTANDEKYTLTPDERTQYQRTRGQTTAQAMDAVMGTDWYKAMNPTDQAEVLNWIGNLANFVAKKEMLESRGQEYGSTTYNKYFEAWQSGTPIEEVVADKYGKLIKDAEETAAANSIIAEAKIPEASKAEAETMSPEAKRYYAGFLKGGVSDETARNLATAMEGSTASGHEQWRQIYDAAGSEGEKAVASLMTDDMKRNWNLAKDAGVSMDDYIKVRENYLDLNENGKKSQDEWNATLDSFTFSSNAAKDKSIKGTLWQILTGSGSTKNNPYDKEAGQKVIDAKAKGGGGSGGASGSGSYAPARIPTQKQPWEMTRSKPSSGLRIKARPQEAARPSGLRITARAK